MRVKVCGITTLEDALLASDLGAHAVGFVFYEKSQRYIEPGEARKISIRLPAFLLKVGVFVEQDDDEIRRIMECVGLDRVQVYRDVMIDPRVVIRAYRVRGKEDVEEAERGAFFPLLDTYADAYGGSGKSFDWELLKGLRRPFILAGGIGLENIEKVLEIGPYAIDVASGLEERPGKKDKRKMEALFQRIKSYEKERILR
jgi:phosphoribosylanthranilate isomerase